MKTLKKQIGELGIREGTSLFVHSSLKAIGSDVKAEELIAALQSSVGKEGTLLFPTFSSRKEDYFDPDTTPSVLGVVTEIFRTMPGTLRSRNPRHPVAARGPAAQILIEDHEHAIGPCGSGTPFEKHARSDGQILLIGVDFDTLTLLHTAEALLDLPYLHVVEGKYLDSDGNVQHISMHQVPGGHRGGVRLFEKEFRKRGLIRYGQAGDARTMLMDAGKILDVMIELLQANPAAALCKGDYCPDCTNFKAKIRARQLSDLGTEVSIILSELPDDPDLFKEMIRRFCGHARFGLLSDLNIVRVPKGKKTPAPPDHMHSWILQPAPVDLMKYESLPPGYNGFAYAPLEAARAGIQPFYDVLYKSKCRDSITDIFIEDGLSNLSGMNSPAINYIHMFCGNGRVALGDGHAQLREIISALRMRNFTGRYHLIIPEGNLFIETLSILKEFWNLIP
ncbi:MAG: AAC(3) family N-acetyltransferase [Candidatus Latescibacteria bacterium]|nr:AAC(3) family N-acetyltransferase [Candidatus Latescibacterota bacterium]